MSVICALHGAAETFDWEGKYPMTSIAERVSVELRYRAWPSRLNAVGVRRSGGACCRTVEENERVHLSCSQCVATDDVVSARFGLRMRDAASREGVPCNQESTDAEQ